MPRGRSPLSTPAGRLVLILVLATCLPELVLTAADHGLVGSPRWRLSAYQHGAFWNGLLADWPALYPGQTAAMFVSHAFLHGGLLHLATNMAVLLGLGSHVANRTGAALFLPLYLVLAIGGGAGFALLSSGLQPMVGASGAIFGLLGIWKYWEWRARRLTGAPMGPLWQSLLGLAVLNAVLWAALGGLLAWEAHFGGFVAGWAAGPVIRRLRLIS